jgi:transposase-like protein
METVTMSYEELDRVRVIERVIERRLTQREAARMLGLTDRQVRRLRRSYERDGPEGLVSKHRGRPSNRRLPCALRRETLATVRSRYEGFGPTLAHEKLTEVHGLQLSVAPALDDRGGPVDSPGSPAAADPTAPPPPAVSRRAHPDRRL